MLAQGAKYQKRASFANDGARRKKVCFKTLATFFSFNFSKNFLAEDNMSQTLYHIPNFGLPCFSHLRGDALQRTWFATPLQSHTKSSLSSTALQVQLNMYYLTQLIFWDQRRLETKDVLFVYQGPVGPNHYHFHSYYWNNSPFLKR